MTTIKNVINILRRDADHHASLGIMAAPTYLRTIADMLGQVKPEQPRYRPPQPSDDGKWCYVEQLPDFKGPHQIFANSTGEYWFDDVTAGEIKIVTNGVWPCERPEGGGA